MIVLGVDPGSIVTGYGLVEKDGSNLTYIGGGDILLPRSWPFYLRVHGIFKSLIDIIQKHNPDEMSVEDIFFSKNVKSALKIGHARGAALVAATSCNLKVFEYSPLQIKQSVVGYGRATKEQVRDMVKLILKLNDKDKLSFDTSDALAAAICHQNWLKFDNIHNR
jgi:crossover junction endodeoxyribonuclease RuvC